MSTPQGQQPEADHIMVIGPDGQPVAVPASAVQDEDEGGDELITHITAGINVGSVVDMPVGIDIRKPDLICFGIFAH